MLKASFEIEQKFNLGLERSFWPDKDGDVFYDQAVSDFGSDFLFKTFPS